MKTNRFALLLSGFLVTPLIPSPRGGWAVVTVEDLPDYAVAGRALSLTFAVRQHGKTPLAGLKPTVEIKADGPAIRFPAASGGQTGRYTAELVIPRAGNWTVTINSGFMESRITLLPLSAIEAGSLPPSIPEAARGRRLFVAKGCITCHVHGEIRGNQVVAVGPELTDRRYPVEVIRQILAPSSAAAAARQMPDLKLRPAEITALTAFINAGRDAAAPSLQGNRH